MSWKAYIHEASVALGMVAEEQGKNIECAAVVIADAIENGSAIYAFGASHSFMLAEEMVYRTGGLMLVNPIYPHGMNLGVRPLTATSKLERVVGLGSELLRGTPAKAGDVLILASTSGRNAVAIDMAITAHEMGVKTIGITSLAYSQGVASRHPSGKKVMDLCGVVIDNCAPLGDAATDIANYQRKVGPMSTLTGIAIVNSIVCEVVKLLVERDIDPPVFMSANMDGGDAFNLRLLERNKDRIHYME